MQFDAIILAGGRASRLGGADKPALVIGGRTLLDHAIDAASGARRTIVVGPPREIDGVETVREDPPYGGPVAALETALSLIESEWMLLLAADLPRAGEAVTLLLRAARPHPEHVDGFALADPQGYTQWLVGLYRTEAVRGAVDALTAARGTPRDASLRSLLGGLTITRVPDLDGLAVDLDTWQDVSEARAREEGDDDTR